jgi:4-hydroxy-tetrahydrodipicolinate synthase
MNKVLTALGGISGILLTPFDADGRINVASLQKIIDRAVDAGVENLVATGNTSEFYALDEDEANQHVAETVKATAGRAIVTAGVGRALPMAYRFLASAENSGADAIILHQPLEPFASPAGTINYIHKIAERTALPIMIYMRNDFFSAAEIAAMLAPANVLGVKYAYPDVLRFAERVRATRDLGKQWVCGLAEVYAGAFYAAGGRGFTSGLINVDPARSVAIRDALDAGDYPAAARLVDSIAAFEVLRAKNASGNNVTVVKEAVNMLGIPVGTVRAPGTETLNAQDRATLQEILASWAAAPAGLKA